MYISFTSWECCIWTIGYGLFGPFMICICVSSLSLTYPYPHQILINVRSVSLWLPGIFLNLKCWHSFTFHSQEEQFYFKCRFTGFIDLNDVVVPFCKVYWSCTDPGKLGLPETSLVDRLELLAGSSSVFSRIWDVFRFPTLEEVATITWDAFQLLKVLIHRESLLKAKLLCQHFIKIKDNLSLSLLIY